MLKNQTDLSHYTAHADDTCNESQRKGCSKIPTAALYIINNIYSVQSMAQTATVLLDCTLDLTNQFLPYSKVYKAKYE